MVLPFPSRTILSIFSFAVLQLLLLSPVTLAAHARKRPVVQIRSSNPYDKQITSFDTNGHIMQLQYAQKAVSKGSSALFVHHGNHIIAVLQSSTTTTTSNSNSNSNSNQKNKSLFRIHHGMLVKMTGLQGDSRLLAKYLMQKALELDWKEGLLLSQDIQNNNQNQLLPLRIQQIANSCAEVQHSLTMKPGARPLAVEAVLFGIDGFDEDTDMNMDMKRRDDAANDNPRNCRRHKLGLYKCHLTGVVDKCQYCIAGNIVNNQMVYNECKQEMEHLLHAKTNTVGNSNKETKAADAADAHHILIVNRMAKLLLKHQLQCQEHTHTSIDESNPHGQLQDSPAVDIYILTPNPKCRGGIQITCATCVRDDDLDRVGKLLQDTSQR